MQHDLSPSLRDIQRSFASTLLGGDEDEVLRWIAGVDARARIDIYRNNVQSSLGEALGEMFPVVRRLVGDGFFSFAAHEFLRSAPPSSPCVADFGNEFADFLAGFEPCRALAYLADMARFERLLHDAARVSDSSSIDAARIGELGGEEAAHLILRLRASAGWLESEWPIAAIWRANQDGCDGTIEPHTGDACLEVCRREGTVEFRAISRSTLRFRVLLARGASLADAIEGAVEREPSFDASRALVDLFGEGMVIGFELERAEYVES